MHRVADYCVSDSRLSQIVIPLLHRELRRDDDALYVMSVVNDGEEGLPYILTDLPTPKSSSCRADTLRLIQCTVYFLADISLRIAIDRVAL